MDKETDQNKILQMCNAVKEFASNFARETFEIPNSLESYLSGTQNSAQTTLFLPLLKEHFKYPIIVEKYNINAIKFLNGSFFAESYISYYALIPREDTSQISKLKKLNYSILGKYQERIQVGHKFPFIVPCNNSDEIFFFAKHFLYYHIYLLLKECEKIPGLFLNLLEAIIEMLRKMFGGIFLIEGDFQKFTLSPQIHSYTTTKQVYDKYIFSRIREFNKLHRKFLYSMQMVNSQPIS